jgi:SAM-dependent methyltransferase
MLEKNNQPSYRLLANHYMQCLLENSQPHLQVDWPNLNDLLKRYQVMYDLIKYRRGPMFETAPSILDFGCGLSGFYKYLCDNNLENTVKYSGLDILPEYIKRSKNLYPKNEYIEADILEYKGSLPDFDFAVINGLFTQKLEMSDDEMYVFLLQILEKIVPIIKNGIAVNFMSPIAEYFKSRAFHPSFQKLSMTIRGRLGIKDFVIRHDYLPYEYCLYLYKI